MAIYQVALILPANVISLAMGDSYLCLHLLYKYICMHLFRNKNVGIERQNSTISVNHGASGDTGTS